jgi:hypothetical protein
VSSNEIAPFGIIQTNIAPHESPKSMNHVSASYELWDVRQRDCPFIYAKKTAELGFKDRNRHSWRLHTILDGALLIAIERNGIKLESKDGELKSLMERSLINQTHTETEIEDRALGTF